MYLVAGLDNRGKSAQKGRNGANAMCLNPITLPNGTQTACHKCWQCRRVKIDDFTGRCIAESQYAAASYSVTLTYGRDTRYNAVDHIRAAALTYSDVRLMFKRMRTDRLPVRYLVVGEYGSLKSRSHWHALMFFPSAVPIVETWKNVDFKYWPHGHTFWQPLDEKSVAYVTKYVAKDVEEEGALYHKGMSKYPPLGDEYFRQLARKYAIDGLAPQTFEYGFADVRKDGKQRRFHMRGKTRENFLRYFRMEWMNLYGDHAPNSEILEKFEDDEAAAGSPEKAREIIAGEKVGLYGLRDSLPDKDMAPRYKVPKPTREELRRFMEPERVKFSETLNVWLYDFGDGSPWYWAMDDEGAFGWRARIGVRSKNDASKSYSDASRGQ